MAMLCYVSHNQTVYQQTCSHQILPSDPILASDPQETIDPQGLDNGTLHHLQTCSEHGFNRVVAWTAWTGPWWTENRAWKSPRNRGFSHGFLEENPRTNPQTQWRLGKSWNSTGNSPLPPVKHQLYLEIYWVGMAVEFFSTCCWSFRVLRKYCFISSSPWSRRLAMTAGPAAGAAGPAGGVSMTIGPSEGIIGWMKLISLSKHMAAWNKTSWKTLENLAKK